MRYLNYVKNIAILLSLLVISIPFVFAEEYSRTYDANGNLISDGQYYREYDGLNQLVRVRLGNTSSSPVLEEYRWHPIDERIIQKKVYYNGVYNYTVYYPNENFVQIVNSSGTFTEKYVYQDSFLVAQINTDGQKQAIHNDHKGTNTLITNSSGGVIENTFYSPYGEIISGGKNSRYGYEGKEYDSLTDDIDFKFRKYETDIPIFDKPDTLIQNVYDPQLLNRYSFERNNPFRYTDDNGHLIQSVALFIYETVVLPIWGLILEYIPANMIANMGAAAERAAFLKAGRELFDIAFAETPEFKIGVGTDPESVPLDQRFVITVFNNANPSASEQTQGTQLDVEVKTPLNSDICEITNTNVCDQREGNKDSEGVKKPEDVKELLDKLEEKEDDEEKPQGTGGGPGGSSGGGSSDCSWWAPCIVTYDSNS